MTGLYTYIDGESHFERSADAWRRILIDDSASLAEVEYVEDHSDGLFFLDPKIRVFWSKRFSPGSKRSLYFTSADQQQSYAAKVALSSFGLEPQISPDTKQLWRGRQSLLKSHRVIEKPKGVDSALFVQALEDAHGERCDACHIYTSDADYGNLVNAVKGQGIYVTVFGFDNSLGEFNPLRHVANQFIDLEQVYRAEFRRKAKVSSAEASS